MTLGGMNIKPGDMIAPLPVCLHHKNNIYSSPSIFNPDRFLANISNNRTVNGRKYPPVPRTMFLPFGRGGRNCVGQYLGQMMVKIVSSEFIKAFEFTTTSDDFKIELDFDPIYGVVNANLNIRNAV